MPTRGNECVQVINDNTKSKAIKSLPTTPQDVTLEGKSTYAAAAAKVIKPEHYVSQIVSNRKKMLTN